MNKKCEICKWDEGYCHKHHIIPLSKDGKDDNDNIMILCPNHHSEATKIGYKNFNLKYKIKRGQLDNKKLLNEVALSYYQFFKKWDNKNPNTYMAIKQNKRYFEDIFKICKENNWDELDMLAQLMGTTRRHVVTNFIN